MREASTNRRALLGVLVLAVAVIAAGALLRAGSQSVTQVWTGLGGTSYWGTAANWDPPGVPSGIGRLVFPAGSQSTNNSALNNPDYSFDLYLGEAVLIDGNVIPSCLVTTYPFGLGAPRRNSNPSTIRDLRAPIRDNNACPDGTVFDVAAGTEILFWGAPRMSALKKQGPGTLYLDSFEGLAIRQDAITSGTHLIVTEGTLHVDTTLPTSDVALQGGVLAGSGTVGAVTATGGTEAPATGGTLSPEASPLAGVTGARSVRRRGLGGATAILSTGNLLLDSTATVALQLDGNTPGVNQDQLAVSGTVSLGNATLTTSFGSVPSPGTVFVIITNDGIDPVDGTFNNLPEGATIPISGPIVGRISYVGGHNDVTITAITGVPVMPHAMLFVLGAIVLAIGMRQLRLRAR